MQAQSNYETLHNRKQQEERQNQEHLQLFIPGFLPTLNTACEHFDILIT